MTGRVRRGAAIAGAVVVIVVASVALDRTRREFDLTAERSLSLTDTSRSIARAVDAPVRVTAFLRRSEPGRAEAAALLGRYARVNRRITYRLLDPDDAPGDVRRLGVDPVLGGLALESDGRVERGPTVTEQDVTAGLARLARDVDATICWTTGHGETPPGDAPGLAGVLRDNGYEIEALDLATATESSLPASCSALLVIAPRVEFGSAGAAAVSSFLDGGGRALVLGDPGGTTDLDAVLDRFGLGLEPGIVVETNERGHVPGDPATPLVAAYRSGFPFVRRLPPTFFPGALAVRVDPDPPDGVAASAVALTTSGGYLERNPADPSVGAEDVRGPIALVAAADRSRVDGDRIVRSRVVVSGDADFASDEFIGELGNALLVVQAFDWLTLEEDLVAVSANLPRVRPLTLTAARVTYARALTAGVVPAAFLLAGAMVWAVRRGR